MQSPKSGATNHATFSQVVRLTQSIGRDSWNRSKSSFAQPVSHARRRRTIRQVAAVSGIVTFTPPLFHVGGWMGIGKEDVALAPIIGRRGAGEFHTGILDSFGMLPCTEGLVKAAGPLRGRSDDCLSLQVSGKNFKQIFEVPVRCQSPR